MWLLDVYRKKNKVVLWFKTKEGNKRVEKPFVAVFYVQIKGKPLIESFGLDYSIETKTDHLGNKMKVCEVPVFNLNKFENIVNSIEKKAKHRLTLYNGDLTPEQQFLFYYNLFPGKKTDPYTLSQADSDIALKSCCISYRNGLVMNGESKSLEGFVNDFKKLDPDVIVMENAFSDLPKLAYDIAKAGLSCPFHRWDSTGIKYKGGKSFFSYGEVLYHDFAIRLRGRFLVDTGSVIGGECDVEGVMELCRLTGAQFQQVASRSFGAAFQLSLVRLMYRKGLLVPYKEKPVDIPLSMYDMLKGDRGGHTFDPAVGFHKDVFEIDFTSMFPFIIYNKNISAETLGERGEKVPGLPIYINHEKKGLVPLAIKSLLDKRIEYKKNPNHLNKSRADALKMVLVTSYGYLRFREFKLGVATSHMAICAYAREFILQSARMAEERGFKVLHGIVDSLYVKKEGASEEEVKEFCDELTKQFGIPAEYKGRFKWITFLPSINDAERPLPACYYGCFYDKSVKARGVELRKRNTPPVVKLFQQKILEAMSECDSKKEIKNRLGEFCSVLRKLADYLSKVKGEWLKHSIRISKTDYEKNSAQKQVINQLKEKGDKIYPGQKIEYVVVNNRAVLLRDHRGNCDIFYYKKLLVRALFNILQPLGVSIEGINTLSSDEKQTLITEFYPRIKFVYIRQKRNYKTNKGLSERMIKKRLEENNWIVWRGGCINIIRQSDVYPNVYRKYRQLIDLLEKHRPGKAEYLQFLCSVHHGMPDFFCYRNGVFKFVECKYRHESLSGRQKKCIQRLLDAGFQVEVHKLVGEETKTREAFVDVKNNEKKIIARQKKLKG